MRTRRSAAGRRHVPRATAALAVVALVAAGCGRGADPSVSGAEEVVASLVALGERSHETRLTASIEVDEGELRALLRERPTLLDLLETDPPLAIDELLAELRRAQTTLGRVALVTGAGDDGSRRYALEVDDEVVVDLRGRTDTDQDRSDPLAPVGATYQAMVDLDRVAALADELSRSDAVDAPGLDADHLAGARESFGELRTQVLALAPEAAPLLDLVAAALDGELVEVTGTLDPRAWLESVAGVAGTDPAALEDELRSALDPGAGDALAIDPAELYGTLLTFSGFRTEGAVTVVDVGVELRRGGEWLLSRLDERLEGLAADGDGDPLGDLGSGTAELRAALEDAPERLEDVGTLRFGPDGMLQQARVALLDAASQLAAASAADDPEAALLADAVADLERTGVSVVLDVTAVGELPTVLGDASTSVTFDELRGVLDSLAAAVGGLLGGLTAGLLDDGLLDDGLLDGLPDTGAADGGGDALGGLLEGGELGLRPDEVPVGACFDDGALFAGDGGSTTVPCEEPHDNEAFAVVELGGPDDPWDPTAVVTSSSRCDEPFEQYVGTPYPESSFFYATITPSQREWQGEGLRTAVCYLFGFEPQVGSAAGSGR